MSETRIAAVLLAAGASRRLGTPKQLVPDGHGVLLVARAARQLVDAGCDPVIVVTGAHGDQVAKAVQGLAVKVIRNPDYADGMGRSIACGVGAMSADPANADVSAVMVAACDMPTVDTTHFRALIDRSMNGEFRTASEYVAPEGADTAPMLLGIPAVFPASDWPWLLALNGDRGAKPLLSDFGTLSVPLFRGMFDIDTPADLSAWRAATLPSPSFPEPRMSSMLAQTALADLEHEVTNTRRMLERVPEAHLDFSPHKKSWPLGKLANHLTDFPFWGTITIQTSVLDFAEPFPPQPPQPTTAAGFVAQLDERMVTFREALANATDEQLMETWTMKNGDTVIMAMPRVAVLRNMVISHMIHHRAQLSIYFRLLDVPLIGLYGPSADEQ